MLIVVAKWNKKCESQGQSTLTPQGISWLNIFKVFSEVLLKTKANLQKSLTH